MSIYLKCRYLFIRQGYLCYNQRMNTVVQAIIQTLYSTDTSVTLTRPEPQFGDYSTNVAMQLAKPLGRSPRDIAEEIVGKLKESGDFVDAEVAGRGHGVRDDALLARLHAQRRGG